MSLVDLLFPKKCLECGKKGRYICSDCLPPLTRTFLVNKCLVVWPYRGVVRKAILVLKYRYAFDVAKELADLIAASIKQSGRKFPKDITLVSVPLHRRRENYRGFNQSAEVGRLLTKKMGWKFAPNLLIRKVATPSQTGLKKEARQKNVHGVFTLSSRYPLIPKSSTLVLFDDVYTTGSTMNEAKKILLQSGFKKIYCLAIAG